MRVFAYTENYASKTVTFITNELKYLDSKHELLLGYSNRINPELYETKHMIRIPYSFNRVYNKFRWWLENLQISYPLKNHSFSKKLNDTINSFKPELIHCHFGTDFLKIISNLSSENKRIPLLISFYGFDATQKLKNEAILRKYKEYMNLKNVFSLAVCDSLVQNINKQIHPTNKAQVLHSGIDVDFFKRKGDLRSDQEFVFLQVSSFTPKKGHLLMLEAFRSFLQAENNNKYKLRLVGFGPEEEKIRSKISELGLQDSVTLSGPVSPNEMVELGSQVNCFVHMSETAANGDMEGLPNVLLEAMALELPILTTQHAGIPDIVTHKVNGILCEEKNLLEYISGFKEIVKWDLCPHNRKKIIDSFSIEKHFQKLDEILLNTCALKN